jgi:hypothetical protein
MLSGSLSSSSYGMSYISTDASLSALLTANANQTCGSTKIDTFTRQNPSGTVYNYNYKLIYSHKLNCNSNKLPDNITGNLLYSGNYSNPSISIKNAGSANFILAGLTTTATVHSLNGEYKSTGSFKLKSDTTNTGSASIDIVIKNLTISKSTQLITGGTATAIITGSTFKKGDFTYNGTLTFKTGSLATLVLNGTTYSINLITGDIIKK